VQGKPGTPDFFTAYTQAVATRSAPQKDVLASVLRAFERSQAFLSLAPRTRADYLAKIKLIDKKFGDFPLAGLTDRRCRGAFMEWRDELAMTSRRQADYAWVVLARVLSWALDRGDIMANPCEKGGRLYDGSRADKIWTNEDIEAFLARAPKHLRLPLLLALWTGQRQGDLLHLPWSAYDGTHIRLVQSKSIRRGNRRKATRVVIPVGAPLKAALDAAAKVKQSTQILVNTRGRTWTEYGFQSVWRKACAAVGVVGVTFHDLRGTAVTRLAVAGCTEAEIASITGHSLRDVAAILDTHYLHRDPALAQSAISKLERSLPSAAATDERDANDFEEKV
jgi:integrase